MKVLLCNSYYRQRGGEDRCFEDERDLLRANGHEVIEYVRHNEELVGRNPLNVAVTTLWNRQAARELTNLVRRERPDVLHCTNTFPLISPAVCHAAHGEGVAVVQALHNFRLLCAGAYLMRDGVPCEDCIGRLIPWPAIRHRCYHDSTASSTGVVAMQLLHRALGTWRRAVDGFFTTTAFARSRFINGGFPAGRVHVKYNSVSPDPGIGDGAGNYVVFVGRLSPEKGLATLLDAWRIDRTLPTLKIAGDGPLAETVATAAQMDSRIESLGRLTEPEVFRVVGSAAALIVPSTWYEGFPKAIIESYAKGTPVIASRLGSLAEVVHDGISGSCCSPGDSRDLADTIHRTLADASRLARMRFAARRLFETQYSLTANFARLIEIYVHALRIRRNESFLPDGATILDQSNLGQLHNAVGKRTDCRQETETCVS